MNDIAFLTPHTGFLALHQRIHLLAYAYQVLALGVGQQLQQLRYTDAWSFLRMIRLKHG